MFLLSKDKPGCRRALGKLRVTLAQTVACGPIRILDEGDYVLGWFNCKPSDNLHVYDDGYIIGKVRFDERRQDEAICHEGPMPDEVQSLLSSIKVKRTVGGLNVEPCNITNVYYSGTSVSNMQLLLADLHGYTPGEMNVALFSVVGWLPGELTLFEEIRKIPLLHAYDLGTQALRPVRMLTLEEATDEVLVERLVDIVPTELPNYIGLSGGYDSRAILGVLLHADADVRLFHWDGPETAVARAVAEQVGLPLIVRGDDLAPPLPAATFTVMTDGQLYAGGAKFSRFRDAFEPHSVFHRSHFSTMIFKNPSGSVWKAAVPLTAIFERVIDHSILVGKRQEIVKGLLVCNRFDDIRAFLKDHLAYQQDYIVFKGRKEMAAWFFYMNRGIRWCQSNADDVSFYSYPVFIEADQRVVELGLRSSVWANMGYERIRTITNRLLPEVTTAYYDGSPSRPHTGVSQWWRKLYNEFAEKAFVQWHGKKRRRNTSDPTGVHETDLSEVSSDSFSHYYAAPNVKALLEAPDVRNYVTRSALTVHHVLGYLEASVQTPELVPPRTEFEA